MLLKLEKNILARTLCPESHPCFEAFKNVYTLIVFVLTLHRHCKGAGCIPAGGFIVDDEFFSTVHSFSFDMCLTSSRD